MLTRPNKRYLVTFPTLAKRQRLCAMIAGITAGLIFSASENVVADGELRLSAPLNATTELQRVPATAPAEGTWTIRPSLAPLRPPQTPSTADAATSEPTSSFASPAAATPVAVAPVAVAPVAVAPVAVAPAAATPVAESSSTRTAVSGAVQASPVGAPLDRFRGPLAQLPSMKTTPSPVQTSPVQTPGDAELDGSATGAFPATNTWLGRGVSVGNGQTAESALTEIAVPAPDDFRSQAVEGNWIARDAINRISPLRDPGFQAAATPSSTAPAAATPTAATPAAATPAAATPSALTGQSQSSSLSSSAAASANRKPVDPLPPPADSLVKGQTQAKAGSATDSSKPAIPADAFTSRSAIPAKSMSLGEAKSLNNRSKSSGENDVANLAPKNTASLQPPRSDLAKKTEQVKVEELAKVDDAAQLKQLQSGKVAAVGSELPKRTPLSNIVDANLSSAKKETVSSEQPRNVALETPTNKSASASVGDLKSDEEQFLDYTGRPAAEIRLTRTVAGMRVGIERTLSYFYARPEDAAGRSNWGMMHSMMVFGADTQVAVGREHVSAIAWIAGNNNCRGQRLLTQDANGIQAKSGVGLQGHQGQFLAILGMCSVPVEYPLYAGKVKYDVEALIDAEKRACKEGEELTFTLIGLAHYMDTDSSWIADDGTRWDFERLIEEELKQPIVGAACGGTHRLMGYTHALRKRYAEGKPITGHWKRAETFTEDFIKYAYSLQNRDGSMSTDWFEGRADNGEVDRKIQTTGHIVEWLLTVTPDDQLQDRRLVAAVNFLLRSIGSDLDRDWSIGPKGHALRSLSMYHQRVFRMGTPWIPASLARSGAETGNRR